MWEIFFILIFQFLFFHKKNNLELISKQTELEIKKHQFTTPESTIIEFLNWYKKNQERLNNIALIKGGGMDKDSMTFYRINYTAANKYLSELNKSSFLSKKYCDDLNKYLKHCDENFKKYPQNDGPARGLDFDLIMKAQDYTDVMDNIQTAKFIEEKKINNSVFNTVLFNNNYKMTFMLGKYNDKWLIDKINGDFVYKN